MSTIVVEVEPRDSTGKGHNRRLRAKGLIPAVVYGEKAESVPVSVDPNVIASILRSHAGSNTIFELRIKGRKSSDNVMIKDYQLEPVEHELLHADLIRVAMDHAMTVSVNVELQGTPYGVKNEGGILDFITRSVEITCLPGDIPETIVADISGLALGEHLRAGDLVMPEKVTVETAPGVVIAHVITPKVVEEEEEAAAEAEEVVEAEEGAEPEVIKKGKAEEEEGSSKE
jgi:large subunit ribosomal protein L25